MLRRDLFHAPSKGHRTVLLHPHLANALYYDVPLMLSAKSLVRLDEIDPMIVCTWSGCTCTADLSLKI